MPFLAFDVGEKRVGVAVGEGLTGQARALPTLPTGDQEALARLWAEWAPEAAIVGWPLTETGEEQRATVQARRFARTLHARFGCPVYACDERYSSRAADDRLRAARASGQLGRRVRKADRDAQAAVVILEQWFAEGGPAAGRRIDPDALAS
jgi:putative Holliday junction resolvase